MSTPVRLHKKPTREDYMRDINCWIQRNFYILCAIAIMILLVVFVVACFTIVGASATESGVQYNHFQDVI